MGGAIVSRFAATYGEQKLRSLVLLAPAGHGAMDKTLPWWLLARVLRLPVLPQILARHLVANADPLKDWENPDGCAHTAAYIAMQEARTCGKKTKNFDVILVDVVAIPRPFISFTPHEHRVRYPT